MTNKFPLFLNDWDFVAGHDNWRGEDWSPVKQLMYDFEIKSEDLEGVNILVASYTYENYSGDAFVLFEKDGKLYEVNGGHCSCYGLEGQWSPEEAMLDELVHRMTEGTFGRDYGEYNWTTGEYSYVNVFADELLSLIQELRNA